MKKKKPSCYLAFILFLLVSGCQEDEERVELLTLTFEPNYFSQFDGNPVSRWVLLSDGSGSTLDYKEIKGDETELKFSGRSVEKLSLTFFTYSFFKGHSLGDRKQFSVNTKMDLIPGQVISFRNPDPRESTPIPEVIDRSSFTITSYSDTNNAFEAFHISDGFFCCYNTLDYTTINYQPPTFVADIRLRENPADILIVSYHNGLPVYKWINDIEPGNEVTVDFSSFEVSNLIPINKPVGRGSVRSIVNPNYIGDISRGHILSSFNNRMVSLSSATNPTYALGYLEGFDTYFTEVSEKGYCCETGTDVSYRKLGSIPSSINLPNNSFQLNGTMITNFSYSFTNDYTYKEAYFENEESPTLGITWSVLAPKGTKIVTPKLPRELIKLYPEMGNEVIHFSFIEFRQHLDGYTYQDMLEDSYSYRLRATYEWIRYTYRLIQ